MYAVCKNGRCAQTYLIDDIIKGRSKEVFMKDIQITKGYRCEKCNGIVVDTDGNAMFSGNPTVIKYTTIEELKQQKKLRQKEARRKLKEAKRELKQLKNENH